MTKQKMIDMVNESCTDMPITDKPIRDMLIGYINTVYDAGFEEGMRVATEIQSQAFDMLIGKKNTGRNRMDMLDQKQEMGEFD